MKRRVWLLLAGLGAIAIAIALFTLPANKESEFPGYMEADLVLVRFRLTCRRSFAAVSPGVSGQFRRTQRAPMLVRWP